MRLDDQFADHPKIERLSDRAFRLHIAGLCYCGRFLSDGFIPEDRVRRLVRKVTKSMVDELVAGRLWTAVEGGFEVLGFLEYNPSKAKVEKDRAEAAERKRRWAERNAVRNTVPRRVPNTAPTRPDPKGRGSVGSSTRARPVSPLPSEGDTTSETKLDEQQVALNVGAARAARTRLHRETA